MVHYEIQGKIAVITGATKDEVDITLPETIENYPVAKIESQAFMEMPKLKRIVIPKTVRVIGSYAFASCPVLSEVVFEEGVETIEDWAFIACAIVDFEIPKSLKDCGTNAFLGNQVKEKIDKYIKDKDTHKVKGRSNGHCAVFPMELMEARTSINSDIIASRARYIDSQFDDIDEGKMTEADLDMPVVFDGDEFMVAVWHKKEMPNITFELAAESKALIGVYSETDPDFLILKVNVLANGNLVTTFQIKTPYLEGIEFTNKETNTNVANGLNYCFCHCVVQEACYGTGNYDREFAINMFNHLDGKFRTELKQKLITEDQYDEARDAIDSAVINVTQGFLSQIDGAPKWTFCIQMKRAMENDTSLSQPTLQDYVFKHTVQYYNELSDIHSLMRIVFDTLDEHIKAIEEIGKAPLEELKKKYDLSIVDAQGIDITEEQAAAYKDKFIDLETNYNLHGDFLIYIYKEMQKLQNKFALMAFQA